MNAMDVALICKALGDANSWKLYRCCRMEKSAGINFWKDLKLPSQLYPMMNFPEIL